MLPKTFDTLNSTHFNQLWKIKPAKQNLSLHYNTLKIDTLKIAVNDQFEIKYNFSYQVSLLFSCQSLGPLERKQRCSYAHQWREAMIMFSLISYNVFTCSQMWSAVLIKQSVLLVHHLAYLYKFTCSLLTYLHI